MTKWAQVELMRYHHISLTMTYYANVDDAATQAILSRDSGQFCERNTSRNTGGSATADEETKNPASP